MVSGEELLDPLAVKAGDVLALDLLGAFGFAGVGVGAAAETEFVHTAYHLLDALVGFDLSLRKHGEVSYLGADEEHGAGVLAGGNAGSAADAFGGIHSHIGEAFGDGDAVGVGHTASGDADVAAGLDDLVEGRAVDDEVADDGEGFGAPRLDPYLVAVVELAHVELTGGDAVVVAVGTAVDVESAHAADAFAAVVVEADGVGYVVVDELFVEDVEHLEERTLRRYVADLVGLEATFCLGVLLTPYMKCEVHCLIFFFTKTKTITKKGLLPFWFSFWFPFWFSFSFSF